MSEVLDHARVTARQQHDCDTCFAKIEPGSRYCRDKVLTDSRITTWRTCEPCTDIVDLVWNYFEMTPGDDIGAEDFYEWARESPHDERAAAYLARRAARGGGETSRDKQRAAETARRAEIECAVATAEMDLERMEDAVGPAMLEPWRRRVMKLRAELRAFSTNRSGSPTTATQDPASDVSCGDDTEQESLR